jgi:hypothetical protein
MIVLHIISWIIIGLAASAWLAVLIATGVYTGMDMWSKEHEVVVQRDDDGPSVN